MAGARSDPSDKSDWSDLSDNETPAGNGSNGATVGIWLPRLGAPRCRGTLFSPASCGRQAAGLSAGALSDPSDKSDRSDLSDNEAPVGNGSTGSTGATVGQQNDQVGRWRHQ